MTSDSRTKEAQEGTCEPQYNRCLDLKRQVGLTSLAYTDRNVVISADSDRHVEVWNPATGQQINALRGLARPAVDLEPSADGTEVGTWAG